MIPSFNIQPGESPQAVSERRKIAMLLMKEGMDTSPVRHWTQGAARVAQAMMGGMELAKADQSERNAGTSVVDALRKMNDQGGVPAPAPAAAPAAPAAPAPNPAGVPMASTAGKVYSNDEPSPLDPPSGGERDLAVRTVLAEAGNQGPTGMQAVASVLRNRAVNGGFGGDTPTGVITKPFQFEPMNTPQGRQRMASYDPNSPAYQNADAALTRAYAGEDPTSGATHFYAPKAQAALGRPAPSWDNGTGQDIGDHRFLGGAGTPPVVAGMTPDVVSAQSRAPAQAPVPQQPVAAQPAAQPEASRNAPMIPPRVAEGIYSLIANPATRDYGLQLVSQFVKPSQATFGVIGKDEFNKDIMGWIDPLRQTTTPANGAQPQQAQGGERAIPPAPPGVDPKIWRDEQSKSKVKDALPADFSDQSKLRNDALALPSYKNLAQVAPVYKSMSEAASRDTRAADLNMIYGMAKIMDPGSVVREGEMTMAQAIGTLPQRLQAMISSQLNETGRLTLGIRKEIMDEAFGRTQQYASEYQREADWMRGVATRNRMHPDDVVPTFGEFSPWAPAGQAGISQVPIPQARPKMLNQSGIAPQTSSIDVLLQKYGGQRG